MKSPITQTTDANLLMWRMIRSMQIPLPDAIRENEITVEALSGMIDNCARCPQPRTCALYLDARDDQTAAPPGFCPNRRVLGLLRAAHADEIRRSAT